MSDHTAIMLHGAGTGSWVWERVATAMTTPTVALDVPGRVEGATPDGCAAQLVADIDAAGVNDVVLVVHSLSGVLASDLAQRLGPRLRHVVYVSAVIPSAGRSFVDAIGFPAGFVLRVLFRFNRSGLSPAESMIRGELCNDLDESDTARVVARYEAEFPGLYVTPVGRPPAVPSTYVRLSRDKSLAPALQSKMVAHLDSPHQVEVDAGHLVMLSQPTELAAILDATSASV